MFKVGIFLVISIAACYGDTTPKPVYCGEIPNQVLTCLKTPHLLPPQATSKCNSDTSTELISTSCFDKVIKDSRMALVQGATMACTRMTCAFRGNKWLLNDGTVDKAKVTAHFTQLAKDYLEWKTTIDTVVQSCVERQLPPQGVHLNCPAYDIMHCAMLNFIKKAPESQWPSSQECAYSRQYAGACPVCPSDCFANLVPYGSCNACYATTT